jgi:hypothetical protein
MKTLNHYKEYKMKLIVFISVLQFCMVTNVFAHGDDKLGPNGGYVYMPGTFHTELVPVQDGTFKVYLLDLSFKNPKTLDSSVDMKYILNKKEVVYTCKVMNETFFQCSSEEIKGKINRGNIEIKAIRSNVKANVAKYSLPLRIKSKKNEKNLKHDM